MMKVTRKRSWEAEERELHGPRPMPEPEKSTSQCGVVDIGFDIAAQSVTLMLIVFRFAPTDAAPIM